MLFSTKIKSPFFNRIKHSLICHSTSSPYYPRMSNIFVLFVLYEQVHIIHHFPPLLHHNYNVIHFLPAYHSCILNTQSSHVFNATKFCKVHNFASHSHYKYHNCISQSLNVPNYIMTSLSAFSIQHNSYISKTPNSHDSLNQNFYCEMFKPPFLFQKSTISSSLFALHQTTQRGTGE